MTHSTLCHRLTELESYYNKLRGEQHSIKKQIKKIEQQIDVAQDNLVNAQEAILFVQQVANETQIHFAGILSNLVTKALHDIFPEPYEFRIEFESKRGQTEASIKLIREGKSAIDPMDASGGGVVDVVSFALRIAFFLLTSPKPRKVLILDEPFKFVSRDLQPRIGALITELSETLGIQFIIVTHEEDLGI